MQMSEKRNNLSLKSEKGKRRLSGWDNIIWKLKKKTECSFFPPSPPFCNRRGAKKTPSSAKVRKILQFLFFCILFCRGWGLGFSPSSPHPKTGLNPTSGRCWERLPRKFCSRDRGGCFLEGERLQGRWGGGTERGLCGQFYVAFLAGRELQRGVCKSEGGDVWATATGQSLWPLWVCAHLPPLLPCPGLPDCPRAVLLPSVGNGDFPAALARGAVALRDVLVSVGPGISAEASRGRGGF